MKIMDDELYKKVYKAMCDAWAVLDSANNPDFEREYKQLDKAIDDFYFWYNKKESQI